MKRKNKVRQNQVNYIYSIIKFWYKFCWVPLRRYGQDINAHIITSKVNFIYHVDEKESEVFSCEWDADKNLTTRLNGLLKIKYLFAAYLYVNNQIWS